MNYLITERHLALKLSGFPEVLIDLKKLRNACPCAHCNGERDVFGNIYKLESGSTLLEASFKINNIKLVGNYAIKVFWADNHSNGIYTFEFLKKLSYED